MLLTVHTSRPDVHAIVEPQVDVVDLRDLFPETPGKVEIRLHTLDETFVANTNQRRVVFQDDDGIAYVGDVDLRDALRQIRPALELRQHPAGQRGAVPVDEPGALAR